MDNYPVQYLQWPYGLAIHCYLRRTSPKALLGLQTTGPGPHPRKWGGRLQGSTPQHTSLPGMMNSFWNYRKTINTDFISHFCQICAYATFHVSFLSLYSIVFYRKVYLNVWGSVNLMGSPIVLRFDVVAAGDLFCQVPAEIISFSNQRHTAIRMLLLHKILHRSKGFIKYRGKSLNGQ